jgi:6-phosphogluconolactonase
VVQLRSFDDSDALDAAVAELIAERLAEGVERRGEASLVCSGGTTPGRLYDILSGRDLPWAKVDVTGSDERWLDPSDPASLDHLLHARLLKGRAAPAHFTPLKTADPRPEDGEAEVSARLAALPRPFDVVLLGMGADGHTASLFPRAPGLAEALDVSDPALARAVTPEHAAGSTQRMSLTLRALLDSRLIVLMFRGRDKLAVFDAAREATDPLAVPVSAVLRQEAVPVLAYWAP